MAAYDGQTTMFNINTLQKATYVIRPVIFRKVGQFSPSTILKTRYVRD